ncbi:MAG: glycosyltransferase family 39 protein [Actinobacteria bacterium]|nr:glycosyltransferase family 39 protein [Actinomycetota bacterium]
MLEEKYDESKRNFIILLAILIIGGYFAILFRFIHFPAMINADEVDNLIQVRRLLANYSFNTIGFKHPPLYIFFLALIAKIFGYKESVFFASTIVLALILIIAFYFLSREFFDEKVALLSSFFLAVMPYYVFYSVWIKQDTLMTLFMVLSFYFFLKNRNVTSGVFYGLGILTKESTALVTPILFFYLVFTRKLFKLKDLFIQSIVGFGLSFWWFLFYASSVSQGNNMNKGILRVIFDPWLVKTYFKGIKFFSYYFEFMPVELGYVILSGFIIGIIYYLHASLRDNRDDSARYQHPLVFPLLWFLIVYLVATFSSRKLSWFVYQGVPSIAIIGAFGWNFIYQKFKEKSQIAGSTFISIILILSVFNMGKFDAYRYEKIVPLGSEYQAQLKNLSDFVDRVVGKGKRIAMPFKPPVFLYYSEIKEEQVYLLPSRADELTGFIKKNKIDYVFLWPMSGYEVEIRNIYDTKVIRKMYKEIENTAEEKGFSKLHPGELAILKTANIYQKN